MLSSQRQDIVVAGCEALWSVVSNLRRTPAESAPTIGAQDKPENCMHDNLPIKTGRLARRRTVLLDNAELLTDATGRELRSTWKPSVRAVSAATKTR